MPELTDTELIATRLLEWVKIERPKGFNERLQWYESPFDMYRAGVNSSGQALTNPNSWPDLTNWNDIRRMEDALAEKGLLCDYLSILNSLTENDGHDRTVCEQMPRHPRPIQMGFIYGLSSLRATAAQRVAACVKVLLEVDAKAAEASAKEEESRQRKKLYQELMAAKVAELKTKMRCNCDLDNWEPEPITGHSHVCRIHRAAMEAVKYPTVLREVQG